MSAPGHTPKNRLLSTLVGATALTFAGTCLIAAPALAADPVKINILSINDFHGRIEPDGQSAGAAVLACTVDAVRASNPNTLFVSAGDSIGASTFTSFIQDDEPTLDVLNLMDLDVSTFGNHEFDQGQADVNGRVIPNSDFPYISANIKNTATGELVYDPYRVFDVGGVSIGFIGLITEDMPSLVTPTGITGLSFTDMGVAANTYAAQLSDGDATNGEADVVIVLVHDGAPTADLASANGTPYGDLIANADDNIDAIISGHTHIAYTHNVDGMWVTQTGQYGQALGNLELFVDPDTGAITSSTATNVDLVPQTIPCTPDAEVAAVVAAATAEASVLGAVELGAVTADLNRARQSNGTDENRGGESTIGNAIADIQLWAARRTNPGADIAFMNPGGIRANLTYAPSGTEGPGVVTYREAASTQPFANTLVTQDLTGAQILQVLEQQWQPAGSSRPFLKLGISDGFFYTYDPDAPAGQRILSATLGGVALNPTTIYTVVANSFLAAGGDNFATLAQGTNRADTGQVDLTAMVDYFAEFRTLAPDYAQRAVGVNWISDPARAYLSGEQIQVDLSSLLFSTNEPKPTTLTLTLGGVAVGTAVIDPTVVDATDEVGRAQVRVTVPEGVIGTVQLVATDSNGTSVSLPVRVDARQLPATGSTQTRMLMLAALAVTAGLALRRIGATRR